jgi:hypothetical protein
MTIVFKRRTRRNLSSYLWDAGIFLVGLFIVGFMTLSMESKPSVQQTQVADTIIKLLKEPSTTGSGGARP